MQISAFHAKNTLGGLLDRAEKGEEILITRHGRPVARLMPLSGETNRPAPEAAAARIRERARSMALGRFQWEEWKSLRDEGRR